MSISEMTITHLRCEYLSNPLGIDTVVPRLSWILNSVTRGQRQTAYQILVADNKALLEIDAANLWDSGKATSDQTNQVVYNGLTLKSRQQCFWKIRSWDMNGIPTNYSDVASWEMGFLDPSEWEANWIGLPNPLNKKLPPSPYFRKTIHCDGIVKKARLYVSAKGVYEGFINGTRVGNAIFAPGWTDYDKRIQYQTYDVSNQLQDGENVLGLILGTGWYSGHIGFADRNNHYGSQPRIMAQLHVVYEDGTSQVIETDASWSASFGPILYSDFLAGEWYDARLEMKNWCVAGFDASNWKAVTVYPPSNVHLVADCSEPVRITNEIKPLAITSLSDTTYIVDMGQNMVGWLRLHAKGVAGTTIQLRFAEILNADGTLYTENLRTAKQTDTYILGGVPIADYDGVEVFEPHFTFHGFRYVEVTGYPGELTPDRLTGCVINSAMTQTGNFSCSSALINQLQQNIYWGQIGNFLSVPTDCPQRDERLGWLGDAQIFIRTATYNMDVAAFFTKWMEDVVDAQGSNGAFPDIAPRLINLADGAPAWGDAGVIIPWTMYQVYGDTQFITRYWDAMTRWMNYLTLANPQFLRVARLNNNFGDWLSIEAQTPTEVMATAYFGYDALLMSRMAHAIGRPVESDRYKTLYENVRRAFIAAYISEDGHVTGETQTAYVLALYTGLVPDDRRERAVRYLVEDIARRGNHLSTGFVGVSYLCPVLCENGFTDIAYQLALNETFPSWGYSIKHGATTIWERWDGWTAENGPQDAAMNSFNHYSLGSIGQWLYQYVTGIDTDKRSAGYKHIQLRLYLDPRLTNARGEYDSVNGKIVSQWEYQDDFLMWTIVIPPNTTATVTLPTASLTDVSEGGVQLANIPRMNADMASDRVVIEVGSGQYQYKIQNVLWG